MLKRDWRLYAALGVAFALAFGVWLLAEIDSKQRQHAAERDRAATYEYQQRQEGNPRCIHIPSTEFSLCPTEASQPDPRESNANYDLAAQQEMARWAFGLFWASVAGLILTGAGIYFVSRTLDAQLASNRDAHKRFLIEQRAWLSFTISVRSAIIHREEGKDDDNVSLYINLIAQNRGNLPAIHVFFDTPEHAQRAVFSGHDLKEFERRIATHKSQVPTVAGDTVFPDDPDGLKRVAKVIAPVHRDDTVLLAFIPAFVSYRFVGSDEVHITPVVQHIGIDLKAKPGDRIMWDMPFHLNLPPT